MTMRKWRRKRRRRRRRLVENKYDSNLCHQQLLILKHHLYGWPKVHFKPWLWTSLYVQYTSVTDQCTVYSLGEGCFYLSEQTYLCIHSQVWSKLINRATLSSQLSLLHVRIFGSCSDEINSVESGMESSHGSDPDWNTIWRKKYKGGGTGLLQSYSYKMDTSSGVSLLVRIALIWNTWWDYCQSPVLLQVLASTVL